ncbi:MULTISPECIES: WXG100 family type VII secretion target [unclassified Streptomyces]|uniref:WXG100 family type VII secretion target n=1 Tax=unclassified Streptomyces TaxID=2593676 RepID=UPI00211BB24A|nr:MULTISPECIES: WXG100 family type VII secretion target [unclassified Streptomyces]
MTAQEMQAFAKQIEEAIGKIEAERTKLIGTVQGITAGWQGQAATAYTTLQNRVNDDIAKLKESLNAIKHAIEQTTKHYASTEEEQKAMFSTQS